MNAKEFLWHAKRGHGECILELLKENRFNYLKQVNRIVLNNYAFLNNNEYRSFYAYELASHYNMDNIYIKLLIEKIKKTSLENSYMFTYLIDTLYFFLKKKDLNYENIFLKMVIKKVDKNCFSREECLSISALISLIIDLYNRKEKITEIINHHYFLQPCSTLELSDIEMNYNIKFIKKQKDIEKIDLTLFNNYSFLINKIKDKEWVLHNLPLISTYICKSTIEKLIQDIEKKPLNYDNKINILKIIYFSNLCDTKLFKKLFINFYRCDETFDKMLLEIACSLRSKSIKNIGYQLLNSKYSSYGIRIILKNYNYSDYKVIKKSISHLKIDYENKSGWFEVENELIMYFNKRKIDYRLLNEMKYFLKNGLSSMTRYNLTKILIKYSFLNDSEIKNLKLDANVQIRKFLKSK